MNDPDVSRPPARDAAGGEGMSALPPIDADELRLRIRDNIRKRQAAAEHPVPAPDGGAPAPVPPAADLGTLHAGYDVYNVPLTSHRRLLGAGIVLAKRILRKLLAPILSRQVAYNAAVARVLDGIDQRVQASHREGMQRYQTLQQELDQERARAEDERQALAAEQTQFREQLEAHVRQQAQLQAIVQQQRQGAEAVAQAQARLRDELQAAVQQQRQLADALGRLQAELRNEVREPHERALQTLREHVARAERKLRRILHALGGGEAAPAPAVAGGGASALREADFDYAGFEERFRGSEEAIKDRQRGYLDHFRGRASVLEIGCGRGEFLELLGEAGVSARGVDLDLDMVLYCREKGLDVVHADALAYLESLPDESLGGIFAAQVIEHLETPQMTRLVRLCHRKLQPRGVLVLETLNPECLFVLYRWFWVDLSHVRLVHPQTLQFLLESIGFTGVGCRLLPPGDAPVTIPPLEVRDAVVPELARFNAAMDYLNRLLYGSSDYAVIGTK